MQIGRIKGTTRVLGKSQGYIGLPVRDITVRDNKTGETYNAMESAHLLSHDEVDALLRGAPMIMRVMGTAHPPMMLYVDKDWKPDD